MWRASLLACLVLSQHANATVFSEGGSHVSSEEKDAQRSNEYAQNAEYPGYDEDLEQLNRQLVEDETQRAREAALADEIYRSMLLEQILAEEQRKQQQRREAEADDDQQNIDFLENLRAQLLKAGKAEEDVEVEASPVEQQTIKVATEKPQQTQEKKPEVGEKVDESAASAKSAEPPSMQKKGQSEFVSFVDPAASLRTKDVPTIDKRRLEHSVHIEQVKKDGSLLFLAVGTVMVVGTVAGVVGGAFFYRRRRDEPDDQEYAPYAGTGPRKIKTGKGDKGDDNLAYKAQLHHYQQAKQKIICGEANAGMSEEEGDDVEDDNNFSVYECPGLAPTGDLEVHNPNFAASK